MKNIQNIIFFLKISHENNASKYIVVAKIIYRNVVFEYCVHVCLRVFSLLPSPSDMFDILVTGNQK